MQGYRKVIYKQWSGVVSRFVSSDKGMSIQLQSDRRDFKLTDLSDLDKMVSDYRIHNINKRLNVTIHSGNQFLKVQINSLECLTAFVSDIKANITKCSIYQTPNSKRIEFGGYYRIIDTNVENEAEAMAELEKEVAQKEVKRLADEAKVQAEWEAKQEKRCDELGDQYYTLCPEAYRAEMTDHETYKEFCLSLGNRMKWNDSEVYNFHSYYDDWKWDLEENHSNEIPKILNGITPAPKAPVMFGGIDLSALEF